MKATFDTDTLRSEIISLKAQITSLETEIETKEYLISMIKKASTGVRTRGDKTLATRVADIYLADKEKVIKIKELQDLLPDVPYPSLYAVLSKLLKAGTLNRVGHGEYQYGQTIGKAISE